MDEDNGLARRFEASRPRLRAMAYRMLGSLSDAEDAVQEAWIRAAGADAGSVENLEGWLTTIVARVCLDLLRSRKSRREEPLGSEEAAQPDRVPFVPHAPSGLPLGQTAAITGRSPAAARQLASRARRRIQGTTPVSRIRLAMQREVADAFLAASRGGDLGALLAVLDPDVVLHADAASVPSGVPMTIRGAAAVARGARAASVRSRYAGVALVNGTPGIVMAPRGRLMLVLAFTIPAGTISQIDVIADPARLGELDLAVLDH